MNNVLVTGGAGFIGSNFVRYLLARAPAARVVTLDALTYAGSRENLRELPDPSRHQLVEGDITDRALVDRVLQEHAVDTIVHFAAESHVDRSILGPGQFVQTNIVGTFTLLEAARAAWGGPAVSSQQSEGSGQQSAVSSQQSAVSSQQSAVRPDPSPVCGLRSAVCGPRRFHHVSTDEVFGSLGPSDPAFTETTPYDPSSPYSASKAASDHLVRAYARTYGLPVTITNCSNNYGPYQFPEKLIPLMILNALEGKPLPVYGDGLQVRDWLYVEDHCAAILAVLQRGRPGETYNIGGDNQPPNIEIVRQICALVAELRPSSLIPHPSSLIPHPSTLITFVADRPGHDRRYAMDISKIRRELGWQPRESLTTGLRRTVQWYLDHPGWVAAVRQQGGYQQWLQRNYGERSAVSSQRSAGSSQQPAVGGQQSENKENNNVQ